MAADAYTRTAHDADLHAAAQEVEGRLHKIRRRLTVQVEGMRKAADEGTCPQEFECLECHQNIDLKQIGGGHTQMPALLRLPPGQH